MGPQRIQDSQRTRSRLGSNGTERDTLETGTRDLDNARDPCNDSLSSHHRTMLTESNCFDSPEFVNYCRKVEQACEKHFESEYHSPTFCFIDDVELDLILKLYNEGSSLDYAIEEMIECIASAECDNYFEIAPWER